MILSGVATGYYLEIDFGTKLRIVWEPLVSQITLQKDINLGVDDVHSTVLQLLSKHLTIGN